MQKLYPALFSITNFLNRKKLLTQIKSVTDCPYFANFVTRQKNPGYTVLCTSPFYLTGGLSVSFDDIMIRLS